MKNATARGIALFSDEVVASCYAFKYRTLFPCWTCRKTRNTWSYVRKWVSSSKKSKVEMDLGMKKATNTTLSWILFLPTSGDPSLRPHLSIRPTIRFQFAFPCVSIQTMVYSWGLNTIHQLALPSTQPAIAIPTQSSTLSSLSPVLLAAGIGHVLCLTDEGELFVWGDGSKGQLGLGPSVLACEAPRSVQSLLAF